MQAKVLAPKTLSAEAPKALLTLHHSFMGMESARGDTGHQDVCYVITSRRTATGRAVSGKIAEDGFLQLENPQARNPTP